MASAGASLDTNASPAALWTIWSQPQTWYTWNPDVISATLDGPFASGTTGTLVTKQARHRITIVDVSPGHGFSLEARPMPGMRLRFTCEVVATPGGARIGQSVEVTGPLAFLMGGPMAKQIAGTFPPILQALAAAATQSER